jgi:hypothetical protein
MGAPTGWIVRRSGGLFWLTTAVNAATLIGAWVALMVGASGAHGFLLVALPTLLVAAATLTVAALPRLLHAHPHAPRWLRAIGAGVLDAEQITFKHPGWRLIGALGYLGFDMAVLWICLAAVGPTPNIAAVILAYNIGYLANWLPMTGRDRRARRRPDRRSGALRRPGDACRHSGSDLPRDRPAHPGRGGLLAYIRLRPRLTAHVSAYQAQSATPGRS